MVAGRGGAEWKKDRVSSNSRKETAKAADIKTDGYKRGGRIGKEVEMAGEKMKANLSRPGRKMGGRVGCEDSPLSGASKIT